MALPLAHSQCHDAENSVPELRPTIALPVAARRWKNGENPTAVLIAPADTTKPVSLGFGSTYVMDDPITVSPDPSSEIIGRAQGTFSFASLGDPALAMAITMTFTTGPYNGSTLTILGNNPITHAYRQMPILGGTGAFQLAQGIATVNTVTVDIAKLNDILEYHVVILHYY
ncbi:OLC1v1008200C1 [Oldenlandia corymbosa var. corymbosa]|uniref:Dirigent protein n=1 Tax=Oldenlandia corymbosa var. corymbosa TaxID=529605 RepID=A0AAV1DPE1_OLDCO|nr:OLC1v1008200C1 [Oldenlandia corymbosa var. corymbosa]